MPLPPVDIDPVILAARVSRAMSQARRMAYAQLAPDLTVVQISPNFTTLLAESNRDLIGQPITELLGEFVGAEEVLHEILRGDTPIFQLDQVNRGVVEDAPEYLNFLVTPLDENQPDRGLLVLVEDGSENGRLQQTIVQDRNDLRLLQRQITYANEELHRLNRLKSLFLSMSAHDLRTPLTAISGYAGLMLDLMNKGQMPNIRDYLAIVLSQADRLNQLINDFLDLDQIEEGKLTIKPELIDFRDIIQEVTAVMKINADSHQIQLTTDLPNQSLELWADPEKIYRVVYNLVGNAIKYTQRDGRVQIKVRLSDKQIIIQVADNGRGMTEKQRSHLFQMYYRTKDAKQSKIRGTGLGLYIVKTIVEAHQGRVEINSEFGNGSTFTIYLPTIGEI